MSFLPPVTTPAAGYLSQSDVLKRPDWTIAMVKRLLAEPDRCEAWRMGSRSGIRHLYTLDRLSATEQSAAFVEWVAKRKSPTVKLLSLLDALREISHAAHRQRDAAQKFYQSSMYGFATAARKKKEQFYVLKEKGIVVAHKTELLRYVGASPQGMGVYEYGEGGKSCFHSRLHPRGAERVAVPDHPETLFVLAKQRAHAVKDAQFTLAALPDLIAGEYETVEAPRRPRPPIICFNCGCAGHIAADCPDNDEWGNDWED